jgi:CxxC-x17-CxxC domain-containing protein
MYKPRRDSFSDNRNGGGRFGGGDSYPRRENRDRGGFGGGRDREDRPSFEAICAQCGSSCRVPFKPNGTKPVLCKPCFEKDGGSKSGFRDRPSFGGDRGDRGPSRERSFGGDRPETRTLGDRDHKPSNLEIQVTRLEAKLDALIASLSPTAKKQKVHEIPLETPAKEVKAKKEEKTEKKKVSKKAGKAKKEEKE